MICQSCSGSPWQRCTCLGSPLARDRMKFPVMTSLSVPFTAVRQHNDTMVTFEMHPVGPCYYYHPYPRKGFIVPHSQLPLETGLTFKYTSEMIQFKGELRDCSYYRGCWGLSFYWDMTYWWESVVQESMGLTPGSCQHVSELCSLSS